MRNISFSMCIVILLLSVSTIVSAMDITGTWEGYYSTSLVGSTDIKLKLTQSGKRINGTVKGSNGMKGKINGKKTGDNTVKFKITTTTRNCPGTFNGKAIVYNPGKKKLQIENTQFDLKSATSATMNITFTGKDCLGTHKNGKGTVYLVD